MVHIPGDEGVEFCYEYQNRSNQDIIIQATFDGCKSEEVVHCAAGKDGYDAGPCTSAETMRAYRFRNVTTPGRVSDPLITQWKVLIFR
ncbi:uncharacterized protein LAESUDRAFT_732506 [Laetiporus sulphureus 93-53]|uniref:Uncharacterized protein n=1 Tax=Laetiporus sulphureus 93-53 TaxID=1314785 RepID=A0A165B400_9APHY|nr:uncharacterized protein LAESUDRAFT_732506 [Laetiporus sulphureus 93-53]KZT00179.1 hypothetical protein LAESUDRAFT_732506 [Laetiporus sulphureus 93-53]